jgi:acetyl esterase/lipase
MFNLDLFRPIDERRSDMDSLSKYLTYPSKVTVEYINVNGVPCLYFTPYVTVKGKVLLYLHGGAYINGPFSIYGPYISRLSKSCRVNGILVGYRLAPEDSFPAALEDVLTVYTHLITNGIKPSDILIAGDSAGGGLSIASLLAIRDRGLTLPNASLVISPWADLTNSSESHQTKSKKDVMLNRKQLDVDANMYSHGMDLRNPLISPVFADLTGLPPLFIQVGSDEILLSDSLTLAENAQKAGVQVTLKVWDGMFHVWHAMHLIIPEGREAVKEACAFIQERLGSVTTPV